MKSSLLTPWVTTLLLFITGSDGHALWTNADGSPRDRPCPDAISIVPCVCTYHEEVFAMHLDCSAVSDEDELRSVFKAYFPFTEFTSFLITENENLRVLENGVFGEVSFENVHISSGVLETIEEEALSGSFFTMKSIDLYRNSISNFPFHTLPNFSVLKDFEISYNNVSWLPPITSFSLMSFGIGSNPITNLTKETFSGFPELVALGLSSVELTDIPEGLLDDLPNLDYIGLSYNRLTTIPSDAFQTSGNLLRIVLLYDNNITHVEEGAFPDMMEGGTIYLQYNEIAIFEEAVWRPLIEANVTIHLDGNPFLCSCDIAWLVSERPFLDLLPGATCTDGVAFVDLDPDAFDHWCSL